MRRIGRVLFVVALATTCQRTDPAVMGTAASPIDVQVLRTEPGAMRLLLAPGERRAALERDGAGGPGRVEIIEVGNAAVERTVTGRALGAPDDDGSLVYVAAVDERHWAVRTTADTQHVTSIEVPNGQWRLETALGAATGRVIVYTGDARRWIVSIGPDLAVRAQVAAAPGPLDVGPTAALSPDGSRLYVLSGSGATFRVSALSSETLAQGWATTLEPPPRADGTDSSTAKPPAIRVAVAPWGDRPGFLIQPSGDGSHLLVVHGEALHGAITEPLSLFILDTRDGRVTSSRRFRPEGPFIGHVWSAAPVPGSAQVVLLHVSRFREGAAETPTARFGGVTRFDLSTASDPDAYVVSRDALGAEAEAAMKAVVPSAVAVTRSGTVLLVR